MSREIKTIQDRSGNDAEGREVSEPMYLVLNGPHRGKRYPAIAGETLALPDYESLESFPATTTVLYTLRVLAVDDPDGTRKANRFWLTADAPTSGIKMLDLLIDLAGEGTNDENAPPRP